MIRVLVVDNSAAARALITAALRRDPQIQVVGGACDPHEARAAIKALAPDVITLDVDMPGMSGLDFLERLMRLRPMPVVMVADFTAPETDTALHALALGAAECVPKPGRGGSFEGIAVAIHAAADRAIRYDPTPFHGDGAVVAIGASTGGVEALSDILSTFPENCPPTLIVQHIGPAFTRGLAERLDKLCAATVTEAHDGERLCPGRVYLAPGGTAHLALSSAMPWRCALVEGAPVNGHCPAVDVLFESVARTAGPRAVGIILTGMGRDGAQGLLSIRNGGGRTFGQDPQSCVVYGMPRVAFEIGAVQAQVPLGSVTAKAMAAASLSVGAA